jgi:PAS domain-containing protein
MVSDSVFSTAFRDSPIGQYLLAPTDKLEIIAVNDTFLRSVSRAREEVLGMPLFDAFGSNPDDPSDTGVQALGLSIRTAIDTGHSQAMPVQRYPIKMQKDGQTWFEDMYWSATNTPIYDANGRLICVSHTTINITAQVRAEQALRISREEALHNAQLAEAERANLAGVLRAAPVGIIVVDQDLGVLHRNPAHVAMFGSTLPGLADKIDFGRWNGWFLDGPTPGRKLDPHDWPLHRACHGATVVEALLRVRSFDDEPSERMLLVSPPRFSAAMASLPARLR